MSRWRVTDPDGWSETVDVDDRELPTLVAAPGGLVDILVGCPYAFGWKAQNLDTGKLYLPEVIDRAIEHGIETGSIRVVRGGPEAWARAGYQKSD